MSPGRARFSASADVPTDAPAEGESGAESAPPAESTGSADAATPEFDRPLTKVISLADTPMVQTSPSVFGADQIVQAQLSLIRQPIPDFFDALYAMDPASGDGRYFFRVMLRARERQSARWL